MKEDQIEVYNAEQLCSKLQIYCERMGRNPIIENNRGDYGMCYVKDSDGKTYLTAIY